MTDSPKALRVSSHERHTGATQLARRSQESRRGRRRDAIARTRDVQLKMRARGLTVSYGGKSAIRDVSIDVHARQVLALIGPSGCGKSTFLRSLNRMNDTVRASRSRRVTSSSTARPSTGRTSTRCSCGGASGWCFSDPTRSQVDLRERGLRSAHRGRARAERPGRARGACAPARGLWEEVKDRLDESGLSLSGGQQQRLCIARALAVEPEVLLMDEPASALDPIATAKIEDLVSDLRDELTIVIVTHNMQQAARVSQRTGFFYMGRLVEVGETTQIFTRPKSARPRTTSPVGSDRRSPMRLISLALIATGLLFGLHEDASRRARTTRERQQPHRAGPRENDPHPQGVGHDGDPRPALGRGLHEAGHPGVTIQVTGGGSGTGIAALINGTTDICEASRSDEGQGEGRHVRPSAGAPAVETKVALDALAVYVNEKSPLKEISIPALRKIYLGDTTSGRTSAARTTPSSFMAVRTTPGHTATSRSTSSRTRTSPPACRRWPGPRPWRAPSRVTSSASVTAASRISRGSARSK
jgi:phosphate transport system ATP-binding protein